VVIRQFQPRGSKMQISNYLVAAAGLAVAAAQLPNRTATWQLNQSTINMPCNNSGFTNPESTVGWSIIDFE